MMPTTLVCLALRTHHRQVRGFTLLEVMIALVVLAIGVVGLIALQMSTYQQLQTSHNYAKAAALAGAMADRMLANRAQAIANAYNHTAAPVGLVPNCATTACTAAQLATYDMDRWQTEVTGGSPKVPGSLPSATGEIARVGTDLIIRVRWDDDLSGSTGTTCAAAGVVHNPVNLECFELNLGPLI